MADLEGNSLVLKLLAAKAADPAQSAPSRQLELLKNVFDTLTEIETLYAVNGTTARVPRRLIQLVTASIIWTKELKALLTTPENN